MPRNVSLFRPLLGIMSLVLLRLVDSKKSSFCLSALRSVNFVIVSRMLVVLRLMTLRLITLTLVTVMVLTFAILPITGAQAKASVYTDTDQQSGDIVQPPDNLIEYVQTKIKDDDGKQTPSQNTSSINTTQKLQANTELTAEYNEAFYVLDTLNAGLPTLETPPNLQTPLSTLEFFNSAMLQNKFGLAAYALNLNAIESNKQANVALELAKKLDYLLTEKSLYVFDDLPDRTDGLIEPPMGSSSPIYGIPRRSIKLGEVDYKTRHVPIYLQRVKVEGRAPAWVFSSQTVMNIEALYDVHKPPEFERYLPDWLTAKAAGISVWEGLALVLYMFATLGIGFLISKTVAKLVSKYSHRKKEGTGRQELSLTGKSVADLFSKITTPLTISISFASMFALVSGGLPSIQAIATSTRPIIWMCLVFSGLWLGIRVINFFANRYQDLQIDSLDDEEFRKQRKRLTYLSIFRRIFIFIMVIGGLWISLSEFADLDGLGTTLLTSAGIAGAVIGIAAQPTLGNIIAGFQVAVTQPVKIGDTIMLDGVWCEVEDLRYTYAVLKTWDDRRLIVPMKHFVTEIIENWSHTNADQSSAIYLYVDYGADIDAINDKFLEVVKNHELWDKNTDPNMLVTTVTEDAIKLRCKVSSDSPAHAWTLECEVRRQMLDYLAAEQTTHLPTERITLAPRGKQLV